MLIGHKLRSNHAAFIFEPISNNFIYRSAVHFKRGGHLPQIPRRARSKMVPMGDFVPLVHYVVDHRHRELIISSHQSRQIIIEIIIPETPEKTANISVIRGCKSADESLHRQWVAKMCARIPDFEITLDKIRNL